MKKYQCKGTWRLLVTGRVQGVGFRPAVAKLAQKLGWCGWVANRNGGAEIRIQGKRAKLPHFLTALRLLPSPIHLKSLNVGRLTSRRFSGFRIMASTNQELQPWLPADIGICPDCLRELLHPGNRRFHYPYISCAHCGPRYTIMQQLPYDRERTSMGRFLMCRSCQTEYRQPQDRRCYGQTLSCQDCGPQLGGWQPQDWQSPGFSWDFQQPPLLKEDALMIARSLLEAGKIIAVKSVGGYNLVCRADYSSAVKALRQLKQRPTKPLAVLFSSMSLLEKYCWVSCEEKKLLLSTARPIVLLSRRTDSPMKLASELADPWGPLGAFLPMQGLYALLLPEVPLVVTSCNISGEPIIIEDVEAGRYVSDHSLVQGLFTYQRDICQAADDSVCRIINEQRQILRRARGYMPEPIAAASPALKNRVVLALGAQVEPTFALARQKWIYPVAIPGNLNFAAAQERYRDQVRKLEKLLGMQPNILVGDLHPGYYTTEWGRSLGLEFLTLQHHHAHALSVAAEHHLTGRFLAVCFDGTGLGTDGTIWGGEFLLCEGLDFRRWGHLMTISMLGGDQSVKQGWKSALCHLFHAGFGCLERKDWPLAVPEILSSDAVVLHQVWQQHFNTIGSSSIGRLFDGVSAVLGLAAENTHQGRGAMVLEAAAAEALRRKIEPLPLVLKEQAGIFDPAPLFEQLASLERGLRPEQYQDFQLAAALGFHYALVQMIVTAAQACSVKQVVLTGGVFANRLLLTAAVRALKVKGFAVYYNKQVPPGDGGLCLGQAYYGLNHAQ